MIEITTEQDEFVVLNPAHIVYIKHDNGTAIIKMVTNEQFLMNDYDECLDRIRMSDQMVYLDKEGREAADEAQVTAINSDDE